MHVWYHERLEDHIKRESILSDRQYGFRKGRSTLDVIQEVVNIAKRSKEGNSKRRSFWDVVASDVQDALNSAKWNVIMELFKNNKISELKMIDDNLSNRRIFLRVTTGGYRNKWIPQGSTICPFIWNGLYMWNFHEKQLL